MMCQECFVVQICLSLHSTTRFCSQKTNKQLEGLCKGRWFETLNFDCQKPTFNLLHRKPCAGEAQHLCTTLVHSSNDFELGNVGAAVPPSNTFESLESTKPRNTIYTLFHNMSRSLLHFVAHPFLDKMFRKLPRLVDFDKRLAPPHRSTLKS